MNDNLARNILRNNNMNQNSTMNQNNPTNSNNVMNQNMNNIIDLKERKIILCLDNLKAKGIILTSEEYNSALKYYKNLNKDLFEIEKKINSLTKEDVVRKFGEIKKDPNKVSLENIRSFTNPQTGKSYISIHYGYPDDKIKLVENISNIDVNTFFNENKDDDNVVSVSGIVASTDIYENSMQSGKNELRIENVSEFARRGEFGKLSSEGREAVYGLLVSIINHLAGTSNEQKMKLKQLPVDEMLKLFDKDVYIQPEENIVILCTPNVSTDDNIMSVEKRDKDDYALVSLNANGFTFVNENTDSSVNNDQDNYTLEDSDNYDNVEVQKNDEELNEGSNVMSMKEKAKVKRLIKQEK